jgi:hypothetical protein
MGKFNGSGMRRQPAVLRVTSPMRTLVYPTGHTHEGAPGWQRDAKTELFLRGTSKPMGGEKAFYESGAKRDERAIELTRKLAVEDPQWVFEFLVWLRSGGNMRTAPIMLAVEFVHARLAADAIEDPRGWSPQTSGEMTLSRGWNRRIIDLVCQRPDEPGELLAYHLAHFSTPIASKIPMAMKRGLADAAKRLYKEYSLLKYDTSSHAVRFADVEELAHPKPTTEWAHWQGDLFKHAIDRRHGHDAIVPESLDTIAANRRVRAMVADGHFNVLLGSGVIRDAGMTWEDVLSLAGSKIDKAKLWEASIETMGYMALLKNLRGFDEAGVSDTVANRVMTKLMNPAEVARSRQFPFRFYSAYREVPSLRWAHPLEIALNLSLPNIPELPGRTLVLVDTSQSMTQAVSEKSTITAITSASIFGAALALRNHGRTDLFQYADFAARIPVAKGGSVLRTVQAIEKNVNSCGWGTNITGSVQSTYDGHDRVIILTDGQGCSHGRVKAQHVGQAVPANVPVYLFNVEAYTFSPMPTGGGARFDLGGLTDATFSQILRLEAGLAGIWPWEIAA